MRYFSKIIPYLEQEKKTVLLLSEMHTVEEEIEEWKGLWNQEKFSVFFKTEAHRFWLKGNENALTVQHYGEAEYRFSFEKESIVKKEKIPFCYHAPYGQFFFEIEPLAYQWLEEEKKILFTYILYQENKKVQKVELVFDFFK